VKRVYYGWYVVAMSVLVLMLLIGTTFTAFGLFVVPVSTELGLSRADMNTALILLNIGNAAVAPFIGRMLDRFPVQRIMIVSALLMGACLVTLGLSRSLWLSAFVMALPLAIALTGSGTMTATVLVARWFTVQRGRAMALAVIGMSLAGIIVTPAVGVLIQAEGWRTALITSGVVVTVLLLLAALMVRDRPGPGDVESATGAPQPVAPTAQALGEPEKVGALLRMPQFWTIALGAAFAMAIGQALSITLVPLALGAGFTLVKATGLVSAAAGGGISGKLLLAVVADRLDRVALLVGIFLLLAAVNGALLFSKGYFPMLGCAVVMGVMSGALMPIFYALLADRFGPASFGTVRGLMLPIVAVVSAMTVRFAGEVYDRTGDYDLMFCTFIVGLMLASAFMFSTRFFRPPVLSPFRAAKA